MQKFRWLIAVLTLTLIFAMVGCGAKEDTTQGQTETMQQEGTETTGEAAEGGFEQMKAAYVETTQVAMSEWMQKFSDLEAKKNALPEAAQAPMADAWTKLTAAHDAGMAQMTKVEAAGEDTFEAERAAMDAAMGEMQSAMANVESMF